MRLISIFGKGGIGKSTVCSALSTLFRERGDRVLQVGCDPKHDSSLRHAPATEVTTVMDRFVSLGGAMRPQDFEAVIVEDTATGVHVIESGGPEPGKGCAGRAVDLTMTFLEAAPRLKEEYYDTVVLDVLGDVVCGGFASTLRLAAPTDIVIVLSKDFMSLYAANNIAKGISNATTSGASRLVGLVANRVDGELGREMVETFAERLGTRVLGIIPHNEAVFMADGSGPVLGLRAAADYAAACRDVFDKLANVRDEDRVMPTPLTDKELRALYSKVLESLS